MFDLFLWQRRFQEHLELRHFSPRTIEGYLLERKPFFAFLEGLVALKWLSSWLEEGRWYLFGIYCLVASVVVFGLYRAGY